MPHDHPGFDYWEVNDATNPFPVGDIELNSDSKDGATATAEWTLPQALPKPATVAERSIGVVESAQLWFALECTTDLQGNIVCEAVLRGRHVHWFPAHGETGVGPVQEIRLTTGDMRAFGRREALAAHGPHCDLFVANWAVKQATIRCELCVLHFEMSPAQFLQARERSSREAERMPPLRPSVIVPEGPLEPRPAPPPPPDGAMAPVRPFGPLAKVIGFFKRLAWGLFG